MSRPASSPLRTRTLVLSALALLLLGWTPDPPAKGAAPKPSSKGPQLVSAEAPAVLQAISEPGAHLVLVNAWATWCPPCVEEFPDLMRIYRKYQPQGLRLVLVSADLLAQRDEAVSFLAAQGVDFPSFIKDGNDEAFINGLNPDWSGAVPATFIYDGQGKLLHFVEGPVTFDRLDALLGALFGATTATDP